MSYNCTAGDARNEVLTTTELAKLKFNPNHYRVNAYQGMAYDPMRKIVAIRLQDCRESVYNITIRSSSCWVRF